MGIHALYDNNSVDTSYILGLDVFLGPQKLQLHQVLGTTYTKQEFQQYRGHIPGSEYVSDYRPEILNHKEILEKARYTGKIQSMTLEGEGKNGFVVQLSDICIKFKNKDSVTDFKQEKKNYEKIENIYNDHMNHQNFIKIPGFQRLLSDHDMIVMEYIPGFTLAHMFVLKDKNITEKDLQSVLDDPEYEDYHDIVLINQRLKSLVSGNYAMMYDSLFDKIKDHELRTILLYLGVKEDEITNVALLDTEFLIEFTMDKDISNDVRLLYKHWKKVLSDNGINSIDDHGENLKIYNNTLYALDFGNIAFKKKYK